MTDSITDPEPLSANAVAAWLEAHPEFFDDHAQVFAELKVPHPHTGQAVSLGERQVVALRERQHVLERQLANLTRTARQNQQIAMQLHEWTLQLLAETQPERLPERVCHGLAKVFEVPNVELRLWQCPSVDAAWQADVDDEIRWFAESLSRPYCGRDTRFRAVAWLPQTPGSLALVALRSPQRGHTFGLLVLGADSETRFTADMGTIFLEQVGALAGAALARLLQPTNSS